MAAESQDFEPIKIEKRHVTVDFHKYENDVPHQYRGDWVMLKAFGEC